MCGDCLGGAALHRQGGATTERVRVYARIYTYMYMCVYTAILTRQEFKAYEYRGTIPPDTDTQDIPHREFTTCFKGTKSQKSDSAISDE